MQKFIIFFIGLACFLTVSSASAQTLFGTNQTTTGTNTSNTSGNQQQQGPKVLSSQEFKEAVSALHQQRMDELTEKFNQQVAEKSKTNPPPNAPAGPPSSTGSTNTGGTSTQGTGQGWNVRY